MSEKLELRVNGVEITVEADPDQSLLSVLRSSLGQTGTRFGCGASECGACTVLVGDQAVTSCELYCKVHYTPHKQPFRDRVKIVSFNREKIVQVHQLSRDGRWSFRWSLAFLVPSIGIATR